MKKIILSVFAVCTFAGISHAAMITSALAQMVATNFYMQAFQATPALTLTYTQTDNAGQPVYYIYNVGTNKGFVIVSAEDAAHPVLGYSDKGQYVLPADNNNVAYWMNCRAKEIEVARTKNMSATPDIAAEWATYTSGNNTTKRVAKTAVVTPLLSSTWNQSPYYNAYCPGGSVTGCVATAMAQIMRYWQYPAHGHGFASYYDNTKYGYQRNYGLLAADFDTSNYVWSAMPLNLSSNSNMVAELMYDAGVSVCMDYSPSGSGAWVISGDYPICSQNSYVKYFGYNAKTIQGVYKNNYTNSNWIALIENELNNSRPVQYVGNDSVNNAGHTWVCDGYDVSNNFDMNWGWGGADNGYYSPTALNVIGYNFDWWDEAVIGIEPPHVSAYFSGTPTYGCSGMTVTFKDSSIVDAPITAYKWMFPGGSPASSTASKPTVTYNTSGTYDVTEIVTNTNGTDTMVRKAYIGVGSAGTLSLSQDFQSATFPPTGWVNYNPHASTYTWQLAPGVGGYGLSSQCMMFNNALALGYFFTIRTGLWNPPPGKAATDVIGQRQRLYTPMYDFTGVGAPKLYFDVAYAPYNSTFSDTLAIYYSTDCGVTFTQIYMKGGTTLGTCGGKMVSTGADTNANGVFVPLNTNWRTDTIKIPAIANLTSVLFAFENRSGNGSPIYIDNINIPGAPLGVNNASVTQSVSVYPNPSNGKYNIQLTGITGSSLVEVYNILGEKVKSQTLSSKNTMLDISSSPSGIYLYRVISESGALISKGKLVKE